MTKLHCDMQGVAFPCPNTDTAFFYVDGVQRPLCSTCAERLRGRGRRVTLVREAESARGDSESD